jgi:hypothetical protein
MSTFKARKPGLSSRRPSLDDDDKHAKGSLVAGIRKRLPTATSLLIGILVGLMVANVRRVCQVLCVGELRTSLELTTRSRLVAPSWPSF